jgi:hypothetical protein
MVTNQQPKWPPHLKLNSTLTNNHNQTIMKNNNTQPLGEPHDPPPFNLHPIQVCAKSTVKIDNYDGLHEVLIVPFTVTRTVESWLHFTANNNTNSGSGGSNNYRRYGSSYSSYDDRDEDNNMMESDSDSFFDSSEEEDDDDGGENLMESGSEEDDDHDMNDANNSSSSSNGQHHTQPQDASNNNNTSSTTTSSTTTRMKAYWIRELLVETQHGHVKTQVFRATVLYKSDLHWEVALSSSSSSSNNNNEQQRGQQQQQQQPQEVAIKRMSWECIQASRAHRISEDFIKEIAALQYLSSAINNNSNSNVNSSSSDGSSSSNNIVENGAKQQQQQQQQQQQSLSSLKQHHVMTADTIMANQSHVFIVMPYCSGGDIFQRVSQQPNFRFTESQSKYWFRQMLIGLRTLQSCQLCHRDISPENFIIMEDSITLVIDFGMCLRIPYSTTAAATAIEDGEEGSPTTTTTTRQLIKRQMACGKLPHMAPEIRYQRPFDGYAVDIWSTGTVLLFMLTGKRLDGPPRHPEHFFRLLDLRTEYGVSDDAMDLLRRIFRDRPEDRATLEEIWSHPFLQTL